MEEKSCSSESAKTSANSKSGCADKDDMKELKKEDQVITDPSSETGKSCAKQDTLTAVKKPKKPVKLLYQCEFCGKGFPCPRDIKRHRVLHTGKGEYTCHICNRPFGQAYHLQRHMIVHSDSRNFLCPVCGKSFSRSADQLRHTKDHAETRNFKCDMCEATFKRSCHLKTHMNKHISENINLGKFKCHLCSHCFVANWMLSHHLKKKHNITVESQEPGTVASVHINKEYLVKLSLPVIDDASNTDNSLPASYSDSFLKSVCNADVCETSESSESTLDNDQQRSKTLDMDMTFSQEHVSLYKSETAANVIIKEETRSNTEHSNVTELEMHEVLSQGEDKLISSKADNSDTDSYDEVASYETEGVKYLIKCEVSDDIVQKDVMTNDCTEVKREAVIELENVSGNQDVYQSPADIANQEGILADHKFELEGENKPAVGLILNEDVRKNKIPSSGNKTKRCKRPTSEVVGARSDDNDWNSFNFSADYINKVLRRRKRKDKRVYRRPYQCEYCGKQLPSPRDIKRHLVLHTGTGEFVCSVCGKCFGGAYDLNRHMVMHKSERNFLCPICGKSFMRAADQARHVRDHSETRKFQCQECNATFKREDHLKTHMNKHVPEDSPLRKFRCKMCDKGFIQPWLLNYHMRQRHAEKKVSRNDRRIYPGETDSAS